MKSKVRLLLADKHEIFREGLARLLQGEPGIEVVCACCQGWEATAYKHQPDVVLMDTELSECSGIESIQRIQEKLPKTKVIALTHYGEDSNLFSALKAGARAYVTKDTSLEDLVKTINLVADGNVFISASMAAKFYDKFNTSGDPNGTVKARGDFALSKREQAVLNLVSQGSTNEEIANTLDISLHTVKVHMHNIMSKLQAHTRQQAVALAKEKDMLSDVNGGITKTV